MSLLLDEPFDMVDELLDELVDELSVLDGDDIVPLLVPVSVLLREPMLPEPSWRCCSDGVAELSVELGELVVLLSLVGSAEVDGRFDGVGAVDGLEAALGELLLGTDEVCASVTPAALTRATTAAMLKVLVAFFMGLTPVP
ncbi:MAG: hypothetical protein KF891_23050 [Rhizobacter sp.]|nr:hypothetical protein [Rhizobacter sp.]